MRQYIEEKGGELEYYYVYNKIAAISGQDLEFKPVVLQDL
jgi:hypothetical protein